MHSDFRLKLRFWGVRGSIATPLRENLGYGGPKVQPQFPACPLREAEVRLVETPRRWRWQDWGLSNGRENLNRVGGERR